MLEIFFYIAWLLLLLLGVRRITEKPFRIRFVITESAANTYTETELNLPVAPILTRGKIQALEWMKMITDLDQPDLESGQENTAQFILSKDTRTAISGLQTDDILFRRQVLNQDLLTTSGRGSAVHEHLRIDDMTDGDGNGELIVERSIFAAVQGAGNAATITASGYLLVHLVELDAEDAVIAQVLDDA